LSERFARDPSEVLRARHAVGTALRAWGLDTERTVFELVVSELVSNAIMHGSGAIDVRLSADGSTIRLDVGDEGGGDRPAVRDQLPGPGDVGGWGLRFVDELADDWGSTSDATGTNVWMTRTLPGAVPAATLSSDRCDDDRPA
jgi:anti-sigma regulatory factor (Ser/Thr protein kinase)